MKSKRAREAATEGEDFLPVDDIPSEKKRKRGDDEPTQGVKQKKAKKDKKDKKKDQKESRKDKKDKRKNLQDLPEEEEDAEEVAAAPNGNATDEEVPAAKEKDSKRDKKDKKFKSVANGDDGEQAVDDGAQAKLEKKENKKKAKKEKKAAVAAAAAAAAASATTDTTQGGEGEGKENKDNDENETGKNSRYIVFVGNLPFTATAESIRAHFATLNPISVRCLKNKDDKNPCRGIAFVEFANVWTMRTCLDKFHHTMFEDGVSAERKINVELTAGGGGKTKFRQDKIREKNKKLDENRSKRIEKERTAKLEGGGWKKENAAAEGYGHGGGDGGIHPSRLARNPMLATR
ncbi:hypothetical protein QQS21_011568 [Conoideocrella luteorostrata]|uniref:RRM domain-containing protein n=1 Tax=Conoideocrella luteorostrata TaxID=1105319 RepID=A0AAJ0FN98_9HYPO|nr:hypothetical protein QQS21_011568 [Conoideocrella luteorostrata]